MSQNSKYWESVLVYSGATDGTLRVFVTRSACLEKPIWIQCLCYILSSDKHSSGLRFCTQTLSLWLWLSLSKTGLIQRANENILPHGQDESFIPMPIAKFGTNYRLVQLHNNALQDTITKVPALLRDEHWIVCQLSFDLKPEADRVRVFCSGAEWAWSVKVNIMGAHTWRFTFLENWVPSGNKNTWKSRLTFWG